MTLHFKAAATFSTKVNDDFSRKPIFAFVDKSCDDFGMQKPTRIPTCLFTLYLFLYFDSYISVHDGSKLNDVSR